MPNLSIKDVPEAWAEALRQRAALNHRSLQGELMAIIERSVAESGGMGSQAAASAGGRQATRVVGFDGRGFPIVRQGWKAPEQVLAELRARHPEPIHDQLLGADIIRAERDAR